MTSRACHETAPVVLSCVTVDLDGPMEQIRLMHSAAASLGETSSQIVEVDLLEEPASASRSRVSGFADLTLHPGQTKAFNLRLTFRESGDVSAGSASLEIDKDNFNLIYIADLQAKESPDVWWQDRATGLKAKRLLRQYPNALKILPKPPKMEIAILHLKETYFTDEITTFEIELANMEEEGTEVTLEVRFLDRATGHLDFTWGPKVEEKPHGAQSGKPPDSPTGLPGHHVGELAAAARRAETISLKAPPVPTECILEIKALYHLKSDLETPISKNFSTNINFLPPFEANYDMTPLIHPDPWRSYFSVDELEGQHSADDDDDDNPIGLASGLAQRWCLTARVASFADECLVIGDANLYLQSPHGSITCSITKQRQGHGANDEIRPQEMHERKFLMDVQKMSLEDRRSSAVELSLQISWRRVSAADPTSSLVTSTLPVPRLVLPNSEPRVLMSARPSQVVPTLMLLDYMLENPTNHFLTFDLTMEANEEFALSGPKLKSCNILPMSRQLVSFNLLPQVRGRWISPQLKVVDRYFNKTLKVLGTEGMKIDKKGISFWIAADVGDETQAR